uniref:cAMP regulated phosphoprotein 19 n=1 Tax=Paramormyrops kingsleyae TaxID=1676925 RepID=A0A3B3QFA5_9TELE
MSEEIEETKTAEETSTEEQKEMEDKMISPEKAEEAKLKARYPNLGAKPGGSDLLRKRLQKGVSSALPLRMREFGYPVISQFLLNFFSLFLIYNFRLNLTVASFYLKRCVVSDINTVGSGSEGVLRHRVTCLLRVSAAKVL